MDGSSLLSAPNPIIFLDLAIGRTKSFLESTAEFWGLRTGEPMTREQAREAAANVVGFIKTLARWEKAERVQLVLQGRHKPRQKEHDWAFRGLLSCGHCGCAMTAERKKGKYTYYRCTGHRGKCPEKFAREEEVARQFAEALDGIRLDHEVA